MLNRLKPIVKLSPKNTNINKTGNNAFFGDKKTLPPTYAAAEDKKMIISTNKSSSGDVNSITPAITSSKNRKINKFFFINIDLATSYMMHYNLFL